MNSRTRHRMSLKLASLLAFTSLLTYGVSAKADLRRPIQDTQHQYIGQYVKGRTVFSLESLFRLRGRVVQSVIVHGRADFGPLQLTIKGDRLQTLARGVLSLRDRSTQLRLLSQARSMRLIAEGSDAYIESITVVFGRRTRPGLRLHRQIHFPVRGIQTLSLTSLFQLQNYRGMQVSSVTLQTRSRRFSRSSARVCSYRYCSEAVSLQSRNGISTIHLRGQNIGRELNDLSLELRGDLNIESVSIQLVHFRPRVRPLPQPMPRPRPVLVPRSYPIQ
ncbi:MAG: hypothetical protein CL678_03515 [Bdellovibrionaceae bacterium]|nr:hypothetical protein [Pseudobdellovibrionaceae bacterium]